MIESSNVARKVAALLADVRSPHGVAMDASPRHCGAWTAPLFPEGATLAQLFAEWYAGRAVSVRVPMPDAGEYVLEADDRRLVGRGKPPEYR